MTDSEKLTMVRAMTGEKDEEVLSTYLAIAGNKVCRKAFPFNSDENTVPDRYAHIQVEIAVYLLNKRGAEGESSHSENGISRSYENGDVPASLMRDIVPFASVISTTPKEEDEEETEEEPPVIEDDDEEPPEPDEEEEEEDEEDTHEDHGA